jgi:hypothetical protein
LKLETAFKEKAKLNQVRTAENRENLVCQNSDRQESIDTKKELAKLANVSHDDKTKAEQAPLISSINPFSIQS